MKKLFTIILTALTLCVLVACGQRNDLSASDFPTIGSGLTKSELEQAVGKPHESSKNIVEVAQVMAQLLNTSIDTDPNWDIDKNPTEYYLYKLSDGEHAMVALLVDNQVVEITTKPLRYEE